MPVPDPQPKFRRTLSSMIFLSRWLQAPLYFGLIVAQGAYVWHFMVELFHLLHEVPGITEEKIMLSVLGLIDVVMIANLLIMVIIGGYETFVSRLDLKGHPDQPEWLSHVNAGILKVKLAMALIGISSIHLLKSFIHVGTQFQQDKNVDLSTAPLNAEAVVIAIGTSNHVLLWQVVIHAIFLFSALALAWIDRLTYQASAAHASSKH
ncbi:MAG: TIGR00645 family protein [Roseimicrobium sp.]